MQIEALQKDTSSLAQENRRLIEQLKETEWKFNDQKKSVGFWKGQKESRKSSTDKSEY